jgi:hypothetical protein
VLVPLMRVANPLTSASDSSSSSESNESAAWCMLLLPLQSAAMPPRPATCCSSVFPELLPLMQHGEGSSVAADDDKALEMMMGHRER